ncbi:xylose isomerase [Devosia insulae DS-56]|uniref:Xylose isomerase n=2 Tax=Devosia insulae TaxID=408174 RepID=A0A1E5XU85_9HYPH|nr:sugar phosphate isomerase/epimerase [Devosia insulae]OEO32133.1 xylose isomerase [Devosia insulae DS-56]
MMDIGFQLFSARNYPLADVLKKVAALGYSHVEGYGSLYTDPQALKAQLDANGLTMPTAHVSLGDLEDTSKTLKLAETLGIKVVVCPWLAPTDRPTSADGWKKFGDRLQKIGKPFQDAGLTFGYHNHEFEFISYDGKYAMDWLLEAAPAVNVEADVAWIVRGNADPATWLPKFGDRIVAVHVKDIAPAGQNADEDGWADAGQGTVPWKTLWPIVRSQTKAQYFVAEHDNPNDIDRFASRSIAFIKSLGA